LKLRPHQPDGDELVPLLAFIPVGEHTNPVPEGECPVDQFRGSCVRAPVPVIQGEVSIEEGIGICIAEMGQCLAESSDSEPTLLLECAFTRFEHREETPL
jgi:hypothetical protein